MKQTRRFVTSFMDDVDGDTVDLVVLMVSELASNCVRHARTPYTVAVDRSETEVRIEVVDHGEGMPQLRAPSPMEPSGRGLTIVDTMSADWGITTSDRPGKTVWFLVPVPREQDIQTGRIPSR